MEAVKRIEQQNGAAFAGFSSNKRLGMWLFIASDALTFAALLGGYLYLRAGSEYWPRPFAAARIGLAVVMTACLLASSAAMWRAVKAAQRAETAAVRKGLLLTIIGGAAFLTLHLYEWNHLIGEGLRPFAVPQAWVPEGASRLSNFGATFFAVTGMHLLHVLAGLLYLAFVLWRRPRVREEVEVCGLYWQFVDAVWLFVFVLIYLLSVKV